MSVLRIENFQKKFGKIEVLQDINFSLDKGDVLSILGSSGSGKTTLLRCINFLEIADKGKIYVDDNLIYDYSDKQMKKNVNVRECQKNFGMVFQSFNLFPQYTALENVTLAPTLLLKEKLNNKALSKDDTFLNSVEGINEKAKFLLEQVGLADKMNNYPSQLSGGQQQRVSIARALINEPKILFFDEPTSALDPELTGDILKVIRSLAEHHVTMGIVTHEINFAKQVSNKVIFMAQGKVIEEGSPSEVIDHPKNERIKIFLNSIVK